MWPASRWAPFLVTSAPYSFPSVVQVPVRATVRVFGFGLVLTRRANSYPMSVFRADPRANRFLALGANPSRGGAFGARPAAFGHLVEMLISFVPTGQAELDS